MAELLLVEDDDAIGTSLESALRANGHAVKWQRTGASAIAEADSRSFDLVLLDLGLPDLDGVDVCRALRVGQPHTVIVILTARGASIDVIAGLESGADDYLTKPFTLVELLARIRAHLRRAPMMTTVGQGIELGLLRIDPGARTVAVDQAPVDLRAKEFDLLLRLAKQPGVAVSREDLMSDVWDQNWFGSTKTLDVHVAALRRRLTGAGEVAGVSSAALPSITTLRGHGYRLDLSVT